MKDEKMINIDIWKEAYTAANKFCAKKTWRIIDNDSQLFAVVDPISKETYYCCVIGHSGEVFGLVAYRSDIGYAIHRKMYLNAACIKLDSHRDLYFEQDCLMAEFVRKDELSDFDLSIIKQLGFKYKGVEYPKFKNFTPYYAPEEANESDAKILTCCLEVADLVYIELISDQDYLLKEGHVRTWKKASNEEWHESWVKSPETDKKSTTKKIPKIDTSSIRKSNFNFKGIWEVGSIVLAIPVKDGNKFFFPKSCVIADNMSGFIIQQNTLKPSDDMHLNLAELLVKSIKYSGTIPSKIIVSNEETLNYLKLSLPDLNLEIEEQHNLPSIYEFRAMMEHDLQERSFENENFL